MPFQPSAYIRRLQGLRIPAPICATVMVHVIAMSLQTLNAAASQRELTVCMVVDSRLDRAMQALAAAQVTQTFRKVGIDLKWKLSCRNVPVAGSSNGVNAISIEWLDRAPAAASPNALAVARPYAVTGTQISLFYDRLAPVLTNPSARVFLAHILAHEIGHVLIGHNGHSREGLMKQSWSRDEVQRMCREPLMFSSEEANLILSRVEGTTLMAGRR